MNLNIKMNGTWNVIWSIWWYISYWTYNSAVKSTESRPTSTGTNSGQAEKPTTGKYELLKTIGLKMDCIWNIIWSKWWHKRSYGTYDCAVESTESRPASTGTNSRQAETTGKYELLKTIGKGKYAKVMLAKHEPTGEEVAIKIIDKAQLTHRSLRKLYREAKIMEMLDHPNIVKLFKVIETEKTLCLIMEYASGGDMCNYLARHGSMKEGDARTTFRQIVSAVQYCHRMGVVHRDLKTENVLMDGDNNIKIADFGLSNIFTAGDKLETFCGTPRYAAPEMFRDPKYDGPKVDVWSLGVMLYKLVSNAFPFSGSSFPELRKQVVRGEYEIPPCMSPDCVSLLKQLLVLDPGKRASLDTIMKDKWMNQEDGNCH